MLKKLLKELLNLFALLLVALTIIWFLVAQPLFTSQSIHQHSRVLVKAENLKTSVYELVEKFDGRVYDNLKVLNSTAKYIYDKFAQYGSDVSYQTKDTPDTLDYVKMAEVVEGVFLAVGK